jgi:calcineurin-like phosphoesterase family protein
MNPLEQNNAESQPPKETDFVVADTHLGHRGIALHCDRVPWLYPNPDFDPKKPFHFKFNNDKAVHLKSHDDDITANWNNMVPKKATVRILGDFAWNNHKPYIMALNGKKIFVKGNHDRAKQNEDFYKTFRDMDAEEASQVRKECSSWLKRFRNGDIDMNQCMDGVLSSAWVKFMQIHDLGSIDDMTRECLSQFEAVHEMGYRTKIQRQDVTLCHYAMLTWASSCHSSWHLWGHSHGRRPEFDNVLAFDIGVDVWGYAPVPWCAIVKKMKLKEDWIRSHPRASEDFDRPQGNCSRYPWERVIEARKKNKAIMASLGYPIDERMWPGTQSENQSTVLSHADDMDDLED